MISHPIPPVYDRNSRVLILGSFPSVASREAAFFYANRANRFWSVLDGVFGDAVPDSTEGKREYLLAHRIALWDVIAGCEVIGSSDASIRNAEPNDLSPIFSAAKISAVFTNGKTAWRLYNVHLAAEFGEAICLPSTSPANAAWTLEKLVEAWRDVAICAGTETNEHKPGTTE